MPTPTYIPLATVTLASSASSVTFSSIPATFRDLIIITNNRNASTGAVTGILRFNNDSGNNYNRVQAITSGSTPASSSNSNESGFFGWNIPTSTTIGQIIFQIMDYSATDKHKTLLSRYGSAADNIGVMMSAGRYASTSVISSITLTLDSQFASGSTFNLYGIAS